MSIIKAEVLLMKLSSSFTSKLLACFLGAGVLLSFSNRAPAVEILGTGTDALLGNDLTDFEDDGLSDEDVGYDATFFANDEPGFGGGESAFNVFDNRLGPGNDKWCCGVSGGFPTEGLWVGAQLDIGPTFLTHFTVSSANDSPGRDPTEWSFQGSNDGVNYTDIYTQSGSVWDERLQVALFSAGTDFPAQTTAYEYFRMVTFDSENNPTGAYHQIGEIEIFGDQTSVNFGDFNDDGSIDLADYEIMLSNFRSSFPRIESFSKGDNNRNGTVDFPDFLEFADLFAAANPGAAAVPEPATGLMALIGVLGMLLVARKSRR